MTANFKPTPIQFGEEYEAGKIRRLAQQVTDLGNQLATVATKATSGSVPGGGTNNQVLTWLPSTGAPGWAPAPVPASFPYTSLTGVPATFAPAQHLIASASGLGPAHTVQAAGPGAVLKTLGTASAAFQKLNYSELGDVDTSGLTDGFVPAWSNTTNKWQMVPNGAAFSGLVPGTVYTAISPTAAQFLQLTFANIGGSPAAPAQLGSGTPQYGLGDNRMPLRNPAGTAQYASLNEPLNNDSLLTGDGAWKPIRDIEISWAQLSDVPAQLSNLFPKGFQPAAGKGAFLRDDGTWQVVSGTGTVTSVALTMPGIFAVGGSPITGAGTLAVTLSTETANTVWAGPTSGGAATPTFRALVAADVPSSILPGSFSGFANPSALVGLAAINGAATTAMRSDAAPALDVTISPVMTGNWTFTPAAGKAIVINGFTNQYCESMLASSTAGQSFGLLVEAGTNASDVAFFVLDQTATHIFFKLIGDGSFDLGYNGTGSTITGAATGKVSLTGPNGGVTLQLQNLTGVDGRTIIRFVNPANTQTWDVGVDTSGSSTLAWSVRNITGGGTPLTIAAATGAISIAAPVAAATALTVNGISGTVPVLVAPAGTADHSIVLRGPAGGRSTLDLSINGVDKAFFGVNNAAGDLIVGSSLSDLILRSQGFNIDFSTDSGSHMAMQLLAANAGVVVGQPASGNVGLFVNGVAGSLAIDADNGIRAPAIIVDRQPVGEGDIPANGSCVVDEYMLIGAGQNYNIGAGGLLAIGLQAVAPAAFTPTIPTATTPAAAVNRQPATDVYLPPAYNLVVDEYMLISKGNAMIVDAGATLSLGVQQAPPTPTNGIF